MAAGAQDQSPRSGSIDLPGDHTCRGAGQYNRDIAAQAGIEYNLASGFHAGLWGEGRTATGRERRRFVPCRLVVSDGQKIRLGLLRLVGCIDTNAAEDIRTNAYGEEVADAKVVLGSASRSEFRHPASSSRCRSVHPLLELS